MTLPLTYWVFASNVNRVMAFAIGVYVILFGTGLLGLLSDATLYLLQRYVARADRAARKGDTPCNDWRLMD